MNSNVYTAIVTTPKGNADAVKIRASNSTEAFAMLVRLGYRNPRNITKQK